MLTRLRLNNFRRHAETEIRFPPEAQVVLIAGNNGVGKSTILEGILFALYGISRNSIKGRQGRSHLVSLVRRGAELEGLTVELDFEVDGVEYQIQRRLIPGSGKSARSGKHTAVLYGNGTALVEGAIPVTAAVTKLLGMDAHAFKLAVIAQQQELDGLASLRPAERAAQLARLLRLDAITRAQAEARKIYNTELAVVKGLGNLDDVDALTVEAAELESLVDVAGGALAESMQALTDIDAELDATKDIDTNYNSVTTAAARAEGAVTAAEEEVARLTREQAVLVIPDPVPQTGRTMAELAAAAADLERQIAQAEAAKQIADHYRTLTADQERVTTRLVQVSADINAVGSVEATRLRVTDLEATRAATSADLDAIREQLSTLLEQAGAKSAEANLAGERLEQSRSLGANCDACGQEISEEHRHTQVENLAAAVDAATAARTEIVAQGTAARAKERELADRLNALSSELETAREAAATAVRLGQEHVDLVRRRDTYTAQLERLRVTDVDPDDLYARKGELAIELANVQQADAALRAREAALTRKLDLDLALTTAGERLKAARDVLAAAVVDADLEAAYNRRQELVAQRTGEREMVHHWTTQSAVANERLTSTRAALSRAQAALARRRGHEGKAQAATNASRVLAATGELMSTQIRPALEGSVSHLLGALSEGRFSAVRLNDDYAMTVCDDDGKFYPLTEYSGGELDLIALSVRLALASVVADQHGGGAGFLILDECFGSQDTGRKEAILTALRSLRSTYGQILLISHVGGIEDAADLVVEVESGDEDGLRVALARAA